MKDAFGKEIKIGDIVVYATRRSSSQDLNIAIVERISKNKYDDGEFINAKCVKGTGSEFSLGKWNYDLEKFEKISHRNVILRVSHNMMIANGIDMKMSNKS